ncbi:MAG: tetratricopeptide repeat protein [Treponema sp.]|jgi:tetratricopeptide (TPR) repeat protein|nr:tetratricopeptide repeat protein [Treponema sp.]
MRLRFLLCLLLFLPAFGSVEAQNAGNNAAQAAVLYEQGRNFMAVEDWYSASEALLECLRLNPAHAEGTASLAECYYELGEFDEALTWVRRARVLARANASIANLEAGTLIALGRLDAASAVIADILAREPYNREALFAAGELDIARGRPSEALLRYREAVRRYPDDRRLLISLALVSGSLGDSIMALSFIDRALSQHPDDYRVFYYAAYVNAQTGRLPQAIAYSEQTLGLRPGFAPARSLLANLRYRSGQYAEAARLADEAISVNRNDLGAWYLKGLSFIRLGRNAEALTVLGTAIAIDPNNEFVRAALEDTLIAVTSLEDQRRGRWATWHFNRARDFRSRNLIDQALFEFRRGLRLNPYARDRREYAEMLRIQGFPSRYLEELRFLQDLGISDRSLNDAVEAYGSLLSGALFQRWQVNPIELDGRHWNIAVFSVAGQSSHFHVDAGAVASAYVKEILVHDRAIVPMNLELRQASFSQAFRTAREANADYFLIVSAMENERDISLKGELFVGRTGAVAGTFYTYRTGLDRLRNASRGIADQLGAALPFRGKLAQRRQSQGLIDKGKADGVKAETVYDIVKKGRSQLASEGIGFIYADDDIVGRITIDAVDEEVASGVLVRNGFFDRIEAGDEVILNGPGETRAAQEMAANPELRALLRTLR